MRRSIFVLLILVIGVTLWSVASQASSGLRRWLGQTVYVPVFSYIYHGDQPLTLNLAATLSIRNTDPVHPISVIAVKYYDCHGKILREYLKTPVSLKALAATDFFLKESDDAGGFNSFFLVEWKSNKEVSPPIIETIMAGTRANQGISFRCSGQVIKGTP